MTTQLTKTGLAGFTQADFDVFLLQGLEARMAGIQSRIQPKFRAFGEQLTADASVYAGNEMFLHIARHARRKVNPPADTWLAISSNKRGYKAHPHFQLGLYDDHLFIWLAFIYELPNKSAIASTFLSEIDQVMSTVPKDYVLSLDHMKKGCLHVESMTEQDWHDALTRFRDVKKAELLIGRHVQASDAQAADGDFLLHLASSTYQTLMPLYHMAQI